MSSIFHPELARFFSDMPRFLRLGMGVFTVSGAADLVYHGVAAAWPGRLDPFLGPDGYYLHLALFFGMVLIVIGIIQSRPR